MNSPGAGSPTPTTTPNSTLAQTEQSPTPAIEIHKLKKSYGLKPILRHVDLVLPQGERMVLLGANGAGKTTLLRMLAGLIKPSAGTIRVLGLDSVHDAMRLRHAVGFLAHQPYLYEELTALENLLFFARLYAIEGARERAQDLLQRVGMAKRMHERARSLSRGQLQRVAWARTLLHDPHLLLLDEPETGLDQEGHELIDTLLAEHHARGGSVLFTTHQFERAVGLSDSVALLSAGRVVYQKSSSEVSVDELQRVYREVAR